MRRRCLRIILVAGAVAAWACAVQRVRTPDGTTVSQVAYGNGRAVYCEGSGHIDSATGAFVGPCIEAHGGSASSNAVSIMSLVTGALVSIVAGLATAGVL